MDKGGEDEVEGEGEGEATLTDGLITKQHRVGASHATMVKNRDTLPANVWMAKDRKGKWGEVGKPDHHRK